MTTTDYLEADGTLCLHCGRCGSVEGGPVEIDEGMARQIVHCIDCGASWTDEYNLTGVHNLVLEDE